MALFFLAFDEHIINLDLHVSPNLFTKYLIYQPLVCGPCIFQSERYNLVAIKSLAGDESCFLLILL